MDPLSQFAANENKNTNFSTFQYHDLNENQFAESSVLPWVVYDKNFKLPFSQWLHETRPSKLSQKDVAWICVSGPRDHQSQKDIAKRCINWNASKKQIKDQIDQLAKSSQCLTGKWMLFESTENIDSIWFPIAKDVYEGSLGVSCKVSPSEEGQHHLICLYTSNYQDQLDVMKAREILKAKHGIRAVLTYKPDIYTLLEIYAGNPWALKPSLYKS
jgi:hypothetical protein